TLLQRIRGRRAASLLDRCHGRYLYVCGVVSAAYSFALCAPDSDGVQARPQLIRCVRLTTGWPPLRSFSKFAKVRAFMVSFAWPMLSVIGQSGQFPNRSSISADIAR